MNRLYTGLLLVAFSLPFLLPAQAIRGFKQLKKRNYEKAEAFFEHAIVRGRDLPAAEFGLYKLDERNMQELTYQQLQHRYLRLQAIADRFADMPAKRLSRYAKRANLTEDVLSRAMANLQAQALFRVEEADSLLLLDTFMVYMFPPRNNNVQKQFELLEDSLTIKNWCAEDYDVLRSVVKNHPQPWTKRGWIINKTFQERLIVAFVAKHPLHQIGQFAADFPMHWVYTDTYFCFFLQALESKKLDQFASFFEGCPQTNLDQVIIYAFNQPVNDYLWMQLPSLTDTVLRRRVAEILETCRYVANGFPITFSDEKIVARTQVLTALAAPSNRAFYLVKGSLEELQQRRAWDQALDVALWADSVFIDIEYMECFQRYHTYNRDYRWFDNMVDIFRQPALGGKLKPIFGDWTAQQHLVAPLINPDDMSLLAGALQLTKPHASLDVVETTAVGDTIWTLPKPLAHLNSRESEKPMSVTANGEMTLFMRNGKLYTKLKGANLTPVVSANTMPWIGEGCLSRDGQVLIFSAAVQDSLPVENETDTDLFICFYAPLFNTWSEPKPLCALNTPLQERSPFIHADGLTLAFASEGHYCFSGTDIYLTERTDATWETWQTPRNLGKEVNHFKDSGLTTFSAPASGRRLYLANPDGNAAYKSEIYQWDLPANARLPRVLVLDGTIANATPATRMMLTDVFPTLGDQVDSCRVLGDGNFRFLHRDRQLERAYLHAADSTLYSSVIPLQLASVPDVSRLARVPKVIPYKSMLGQEIPFPLEQLSFAPGSALLDEPSRLELDWIARQLTNRRWVILIGGHTDNMEVGDAAQENLSLARALAAKSYLVAKGYPADRIWTQGFAATVPLMKNAAAGKPSVSIWIKP